MTANVEIPDASRRVVFIVVTGPLSRGSGVTGYISEPDLRLRGVGMRFFQATVNLAFRKKAPTVAFRPRNHQWVRRSYLTVKLTG